MCTLGNCLHELHKQAGMEVSVYMDDIILSSNNLDDLKKALEKVEQASERSILPLNKKKQEGPDRMVTAFNIKLSRNNLDITAERLGEFQSIYHASPNQNQKAGILHYVKTVNASQAAMF